MGTFVLLGQEWLGQVSEIVPASLNPHGSVRGEAHSCLNLHTLVRFCGSSRTESLGNQEDHGNAEVDLPHSIPVKSACTRIDFRGAITDRKSFG